MDHDETLKKLVLSFFRSSLNFSINSDDIQRMAWTWQQRLLNETFNNELIKKYPISKTYSKLFLKKIIAYLEPMQEVHDGFYTHLCSVMKNNYSNDDFCYRHYVIDNDLSKIVTIKETNNMVVNGTTGMRTWEAALMLADWALCNKELFSNKNILELGSGIGFSGITIAKFCETCSVLLTDCHIDVLRTIHDNIKINFPLLNQEETVFGTLFRNKHTSLGVAMLDWSNVQDLATDIVPDILIGADIVYDPSILQPLCNVIETFLKRNKLLEVYIMSVIRNEDTFDAFLNTLGMHDIMYEKIEQEQSVFVEWDHNTKRCLLKIKNR